MDVDKLTLNVARANEITAETEGAETVKLEEFREAVTTVMAELVTVWNAWLLVFRDALEPAFANMIRAVSSMMVQLQRAYLCQRLARWMPGRCAAWVAEWWPE